MAALRPIDGRPFDPDKRCGACGELRVTHDPEFFFGWASNPCGCIAEPRGEAVSNAHETSMAKQGGRRQ